jgi:hypothetical protein
MNSQRHTLSDVPREYCPAFEYILMGDLRDLLEEPTNETTSEWLQAVLDALLGMLSDEFDENDDSGYLSVVLERFPSWNLQVTRLRQEQGRLYSRLRELRTRLARGLAYAQIARALRYDLHEWMAALTAYHRHENRLVQLAVNLDVGGGD